MLSFTSQGTDLSVTMTCGQAAAAALRTHSYHVVACTCLSMNAMNQRLHDTHMEQAGSCTNLVLQLDILQVVILTREQAFQS